MKKLFTLTAAVLVLASAFALVSGAASFKPNYDDPCGHVIDLLKADPSKVVKDGVIGDGEYVRYDLSTDPNSTDTDLSICFVSSDNYEIAMEMCATMEYYFSWDETHGFNFAVRYKPAEIIQELDAADPADDPDGRTFDHFARQTAINFVGSTAPVIESDEDMASMLYYTVAKSTVDGHYIKGHWNQLGPTKAYDPVAGSDFSINYGDDGYVTCEWSVPFEKIGVSGEIGSELYFSISSTSGGRLEEDELDGDFSKAYSVKIGDYGFLGRSDGVRKQATAVVTDKSVENDQDHTVGLPTEPSTEEPSTEEPSAEEPPAEEPPTEEPPTEEPPTEEPPVSYAPSTADAATVAATVSAALALGYAIVKRRR